MAGFNFQKQSEYHNRLAQIYNSAPDDIKASVTADKFILDFSVIEHAGRGVEPEKPDEYEIDDYTYSRVLAAFREVYHP